jgi:ketosteroid isomerase-like protein
MTIVPHFLARASWLAVLLSLLSPVGWGQTLATTAAPAATSINVEETHEQLRRVRDQMLDAWKRRDIDALLTNVDPNVVVTWQNGTVSRGPDAIRTFYKTMLGGEASVLANISSTLTVDDLSVLHGPDTAIAFGNIHDDMTFKRPLFWAPLLGGPTSLSVNSRWSATLVRKGGAWKLASYQAGVNPYSNPVLELATQTAGRIGAAIGFIVGALVVLLISWAVRRRQVLPAS